MLRKVTRFFSRFHEFFLRNIVTFSLNASHINNLDCYAVGVTLRDIA